LRCGGIQGCKCSNNHQSSIEVQSLVLCISSHHIAKPLLYAVLNFQGSKFKIMARLEFYKDLEIADFEGEIWKDVYGLRGFVSSIK
jgi:hypothetical protein